MKKIFFPAIKLLDKVSFSKKFFLIFLIIFLFIASSNFVNIKKNQEELDFVRKEQLGLEFINLFYPLLQKHSNIADYPCPT